MARNRVIYQSEALFVSDDASATGSFEHEQLHRVQSANYSFNISRQDINQFGSLSRIDSVVLEAPTVSLDFSYYLSDGVNEQALGFASNDQFDIGFASGHLTASSGKNFYIVTTPEGTDATTAQTPGSVIGIGNAYISDYTLDVSVGSIPTVSVSLEAANISADTTIFGASSSGISTSSPAIAQTDGSKITAGVVLPAVTTGIGADDVTVLRPGDVSITFGNAGTDAEDGPIVDISAGIDGGHIQSASLSLALSRSPLERLGSRFPFARTVDFPVTATFNVSAIVNEVTAANLADIIDSQNAVEINLVLNRPGTSTASAAFKLVGAKLDSESISSSIGSNKSVDLTFSTQIGGPTDATNNILFSGAAHPGLEFTAAETDVGSLRDN